MMYRLIILNGPLNGQRVTVETEPMTLGRDPSCSCVLPDPECALRHAVIEQQDSELRIRDLGSMNRLLINKREAREAILKHGDVVELGRTRFLVQASVQAEVDQAGEARRARRRSAKRVVVPLLVLAGLLATGWLLWRQHDRAAIGQASPDRPPEAPAQAPEEGAPMTETEVAPPAEELPAPPPAPPVESAPEETPSPGSLLAPGALRKLQEDLAAIRATVTELAASSNTAPTANTPPPPPAPTPEASLPAGLLQRARTVAEAGRFREADELLSGALLMDPSYWEAYAERARLFEQRGLLKRASIEWEKVQQQTADPAWLQRAEEARARLEKEREVEGGADAKPVFQIERAEPLRLPPDASSVESRAVTLTIRALSSSWFVDPETLRVEAIFFDRDTETDEVVPSDAVVSIGEVPSEGPWKGGESRELTVTYSLPPPAAGEPPRSRAYYGFAIRLWYEGREQAVVARPPELAPRLPPAAAEPEDHPEAPPADESATPDAAP